MIKFRLYYDIDKEERFLNKMSKNGYGFIKYFAGFYTFKKISPNQYTYRVDFIRDKDTENLDNYVELLEDSGATLIQTWGPWAFFKKEGEFELYTDTQSLIGLYIKIRNLFLILFFTEICCLFCQYDLSKMFEFVI